MDRIHLQEFNAGFDASLPIERAWTPPASWFTSPEFHEFEQANVFDQSWQPVARVEELSAPGSFRSGVAGRSPWVVVRGQDDQLRAFHNTCRHKGREVVQGSGSATELVCGYHAWTYDLEGKLRSAPRMAGIADFDRKAMSLPRMALETWGPWIFINGDPHAAPLSKSVASMTERLEASGWERLRFVSRATWQIECNWKVVVDNYLDGGYHIPHMHPTLDAQLDMDSYRTELFDDGSIQSSRSATAADGRISYDPGGRIGDEALYMWLFPNFMINRYGPCMDTNRVIPRGPDACEVVYEFFFMDDEGDEARQFIAESVAQSAVTQREDIAICESVQLGLKSASYDRGRYAPQVEMGEYHFHRLLAARLDAALAQRSTSD
ncbi:MAG: choline monooxygenase [Chlamydiales bacterium]|jgi:choline monooxygenase